MESSLHRALKRRFAGDLGRVEVRFGPDRVDAVDGDGRLVEVQCGATSALRPKLGRLLAGGHRVRVVVPVIVARRVIRRASATGTDRSARFSPKRGSAFDAFEHLVGLAALLGEEGLEALVLGVEADEVRVPARGRLGFAVADRALRRIVSSHRIGRPADLLALLPDGLPDPFTTRDLADRSGRPEWLARRAAYCLRLSGAAEAVGHRDRFRAYRPVCPDRSTAGAPGPEGGIPPPSHLLRGIV